MCPLGVTAREPDGDAGAPILGRKNLYTTTTKKNIMRQKRHYEKEQLNIC